MRQGRTSAALRGPGGLRLIAVDRLNGYSAARDRSIGKVGRISMQDQVIETAEATSKGSSELRLVWRLVDNKVRDRGTYVVAAVVGTLINVYGQLLVPWFRGASDPLLAFMAEFHSRPGLTTFSIFIAYAFPFCVGIYSAVVARYRLRRIESVADFPDRKPDPVFRQGNRVKERVTS
jgi:hypothetical protein